MIATTRRRFLLGGATAVAVASTVRPSLAQAPAGPFTLAPLPYPPEANEPHIDAQTMTIHHGRHHQAYVTNLNAALKDHLQVAALGLAGMLAKLQELPDTIRTAVRNNGGGHANHTLFWTVMRPPRDTNAPTGKLAEAIAAKFGSLDKFQEAFAAAAAGQFGSGWAWLAAGPGGLEIVATPNQDSPISQGKKPLLGLDVWEHAYYLTYQNRRPDYIKAWWKVVNWDEVGKRFAA